MQVRANGVAEQGDIRRRNVRPALASDFHPHQAIGFEGAQRIANGYAAHAELLGHLALGWQPIARAVLPGHNGLTDLGDDVARRAHRSNAGEGCRLLTVHGPNIIPWLSTLL